MLPLGIIVSASGRKDDPPECERLSKPSTVAAVGSSIRSATTPTSWSPTRTGIPRSSVNRWTIACSLSPGGLDPNGGKRFDEPAPRGSHPQQLEGKDDIMGTGASIVLIAAGAILRFAITIHS